MITLHNTHNVYIYLKKKFGCAVCAHFEKPFFISDVRGRKVCLKNISQTVQKVYESRIIGFSIVILLQRYDYYKL